MPARIVRSHSPALPLLYTSPTAASPRVVSREFWSGIQRHAGRDGVAACSRHQLSTANTHTRQDPAHLARLGIACLTACCPSPIWVSAAWCSLARPKVQTELVRLLTEVDIDSADAARHFALPFYAAEVFCIGATELDK